MNLSGECTVAKTTTPAWLYLKGYFTDLLRKNKQQRKGTQSERKHQPQFYGEALTLDSFYEKVAEEEQRKKEEEEKKKEQRQAEKAAASKARSAKSTSKSQAKKKTVTKKVVKSPPRVRMGSP